MIQDLILHQSLHNFLTIKQPQSRHRLDQQSLMFPQRVLRILPGWSVSSHDDIIRQSCLLALLLKDRIEWFDCLAVRAPVRAVLVLIAGDEQKSLCRGFGQLGYKGFEVEERDQFCHLERFIIIFNQIKDWDFT